jgi:uncharacterized protein YidB (DUF937 family)
LIYGENIFCEGENKMKKGLFIGSILIVALAALAVAGFAFAQTPNPPTPEYPYGSGALGGRGMHGGGMMGGWRQSGSADAEGYGPMHEYMIDAFAQALGMDAGELESQIEQGKTMWQVAQGQGLSDEEISDLMVEARAEAFKQMVADGVISQEQADWMLERMGQMWNYGGGFGSCPGGGGFGGPGRGGGRWNNQPAQPKGTQS